MGEFKTPFPTIVSADIKHIYSGFSQAEPLRDCLSFPPNEQLVWNETRPEEQRIMEYDGEYHCFIPRAPAFEEMSENEIQSVVERLRQQSTDKDTLSKMYVNAYMDKFKSKFRNDRKADEREVARITQRLTRPTAISSIREHQTKTKLQKEAA